jgi:hypothetical protein
MTYYKYDDPKKAYQEALRRIEEAAKNGAKELKLRVWA